MKKILTLAMLVLLTLLLAACDRNIMEELPLFEEPDYTHSMGLVNDKISKSANIEIRLPDSVTKMEATALISFSPEIDGIWVESDSETSVFFDPTEKLEIDKYYSVTLDAPDGVIGKDFQVVDDPRVLTVFPLANSETHEDSEITIMFNRPIVPLTTLDVLGAKEILADVYPETPGKFKWIGTHTLQFIPDDALDTSSNYTVKVHSGNTSVEGLPVEEFEQHFTTRKLRYEHLSDGTTLYNEPIRVQFNQDVDLDRTVSEMTLRKGATEDSPAEEIDFIAEYGTRLSYNAESEEYEEVTDQSTILVYNKRDSHGRAKFWEFEENYDLEINKAYPKIGDIDLGFNRTHIDITGVIESISAEADRSNHVKQSFFDPQGELIVRFYEEIDLKGSKIIAKGLAGMEYGETCKEEDEDRWTSHGVDCEIVPDKKELRLRFDENKLEYGELIELNFESIKNMDGLKLNVDSISREIEVIPEFEVLRSIPAQNGIDASIKELVLCTNTPLVRPAQEDAKENIEMNLDYEFQSWDYSRLVPEDPHSSYKCNAGEFETYIRYGLIPEQDYELKLNLTDQFERQLELKVSFRTETMDSRDLAFYHFQKNYNVTTPDKTVLTYAAFNMNYVNLEICELSAEDMLRSMEKKSYNTYPVFGDCKPIASDNLELEEKYWVKNYFKVDLKNYIGDAKGHYVLSFSHPDYKKSVGHGDNITYEPRIERSYVTVTNLSVVEKKIELWEDIYQGKDLNDDQKSALKNLYWVTRTDNLDPVANAKLEFFSGEKRYSDPQDLQAAGSSQTDENGIALPELVQNLRGVVISTADDSAITSVGESRLEGYGSAYAAEKMYFYTDRPIYRPGHEVHIKGLYRIGYDDNYETLAGEKITVQVFDSKNEQIEEAELEISQFGTVSLDLILDQEAATGTYSVSIAESRYSNVGYFEVEEYVPAPFKLELSSDKEEYISGDTVTLDVDADYYFGVPLEGGTVEYSIASQEYYFDKYQDEYFRFGTDWYRCDYDCSYNDRFVLRDKVELNSEGNAEISEKLDMNALFENADERKSKIFVFYVTVENSKGQAVTMQKSFVVHNGEFYLGLNSSDRFIAKDQEFELKAKSVDVDGIETKVKDIELTISKIDWIEHKRKEVDGGYYYRWDEEYTEVEKMTITTNSNGNWSKKFSLGEEGRYKASLKATDSRGNLISSTYDLYVHGRRQVGVTPSNDTDLELVTNKKELAFGEEGEIVVQSPYEKAKALITIERGEIFDYELVDVEQSILEYTFPVKTEYIPNIFVTVTLLSNDPEIKYGEARFDIDVDKRELDVEVTANKDAYLPGEEVDLQFEVRDADGNPVESELSIAVADLSVLALKGNPKKNPVRFFFQGFPHTISTLSNMKSLLYEVDVPDGTKGGGGADPEDLAKKKRGVFKDTAFWYADLITDSEGHAETSFVLPDNLTTWQIETVGITKDTKLGVSYDEFKARKEIMLVPLKPRFTVPGDIFTIGARIFNQSGDKQKLTVDFESDTLAFLSSKSEKVKIDDAEVETVYFRVGAPSDMQKGTHTFTLSAHNDDYEDTVEQVIDITRNDTYESVATAGYSSEALTTEYIYLPDNIIKDKGYLRVNTSATLAVFLSDALNELIDYPYGCSEQISSKLGAIAVIKKGLNLENIGDNFVLDQVELDGEKYSVDEVVKMGLSKIYATQKESGGFAYYADSASVNYYLTLHVISVLEQLKDAGYAVDENVMKNAKRYLSNYHVSMVYMSKSEAILLANTISQIDNLGIPSNVVNLVKGALKDDKFLNEQISNNVLAELAILLSREEDTFATRNKNKIYDILQNKIEIDARGVFLSVKGGRMWEYYENNVKNTALLLKALVTDDRDNELLDRILRWLLSSRYKDGAWGSTNNNLTVIDAMVDYINWKQENKSEFTLDVLRNDESWGSFEYRPDNILAQDQLETSLKDLDWEVLNKIEFQKTDKNELQNNLYYDLELKYYLPIDQIPPRDEGFSIQRNFYAIDDEEMENPVIEAKVGDVLRGQIKVIVPEAREFVAIEDFIPAGLELVNFNLDTSDKSLIAEDAGPKERWWINWRSNRNFNPNVVEYYDDRLFLFKEHLYPGEYEYEYYARVLIPGEFHHLPAVVSEMYFPENFGRTSGDYFVVKEGALFFYNFNTNGFSLARCLCPDLVVASSGRCKDCFWTFF
ncbi:MAG: alpha-2-macroglobulin family protein [Candidatus Gracilibacteria bacterium]|nr:alpha-2-macroglobulin family protein [Candidatus Gracilibacteria bacterium]